MFTPRTFRNQKEIDMYFHKLKNSLDYNDFLKEQSLKKSIFKRPTHNYVKRNIADTGQRKSTQHFED